MKHKNKVRYAPTFGGAMQPSHVSLPMENHLTRHFALPHYPHVGHTACDLNRSRNKPHAPARPLTLAPQTTSPAPAPSKAVAAALLAKSGKTVDRSSGKRRRAARKQACSHNASSLPVTLLGGALRSSTLKAPPPPGTIKSSRLSKNAASPSQIGLRAARKALYAAISSVSAGRESRRRVV